jgi:hypothetical protein
VNARSSVLSPFIWIAVIGWIVVIGLIAGPTGSGRGGATIGVIVVIWRRLAVERVISDLGVSPSDLPPPRP